MCSDWEAICVWAEDWVCGAIRLRGACSGEQSADGDLLLGWMRCLQLVGKVGVCNREGIAERIRSMLGGRRLMLWKRFCSGSGVL